MKTFDEVHVFLDSTDTPINGEVMHNNITDCERLRAEEPSILYTNQLFYLSFKYGKRLFAHCNGAAHEITLGRCEGTSRIIKPAHNIVNLLMAGEFDWFQLDEGIGRFKKDATVYGVNESCNSVFCAKVVSPKDEFGNIIISTPDIYAPNLDDVRLLCQYDFETDGAVGTFSATKYTFYADESRARECVERARMLSMLNEYSINDLNDEQLGAVVAAIIGNNKTDTE